jgi:transposase-like protein
METDNISKHSGLMAAIRHYSNPLTCVQEVASVKWPGSLPVCPRCSSKKATFLSTRLLWKCRDCKKQFSVKVGTIFEDSPVGLDKWLCAMWMLANCKNGVSSYEIARALEVTQKTAWFMMHRIRYAQHTGSINKMTGTIEADETFIGGAARFMHKHKRAEKVHGRGPGGKEIVFGLLERETGKVRLHHVETRRKGELTSIVREEVRKGSEVMTDELLSYDGLDSEYAHKVINHAEQYVDGNVHTNRMENFWSLLKRSIKGTYVSVEPFHLFRYLDEQSFRYNERELTDSQRFQKVLGSVAGKRLDWKTLTSQEVG